MTCLIQAFSALQYEYLAWRTVDLLGALPHSRKRVILVATRDGINPHDILFEANPKCECEEIQRSGEKKLGNEYSSSSAICALCQRSEDAPTIQDIGLMMNTQFSSTTSSLASSFGSNRSLHVKLLANAVAVPHSEWSRSQVQTRFEIRLKRRKTRRKIGGRLPFSQHER